MTNHEQIESFLHQCLEGTDCFLVSFKVKPTNNYKIFLDSDSGLTLEKCLKVNRQLRRSIEEVGIYPDGDFSLEVSSPGVDAPLKLHRQYLKNIGRSLEIELIDEEAKGITGKLVVVEDDKIILENIVKQKKSVKTEPEIIKTEVQLSDIKSATVVIEF
ncbi:MAG: ribosome maturation factor [Chitinophagaceae bacterium]|jgi:ribosome maturation factor RimP|nr:ribosome maturation factor [Chitinophagaceae bacterium]